MHFSPRENEVGELMMPKLISPHAYDEEDKRQMPFLLFLHVSKSQYFFPIGKPA